MTFRLPGQVEKADYVLRQFDRLAGKYDFANDLISFGMHRLWKRQAVEELLNIAGSRTASLSAQCSTGLNTGCCAADNDRLGQSGSGQRYLDVCTGTGDMALLIACRPGFKRTVVGLDFSEKMLAVARQRCARNKSALPAVSFQQGDAENLPFADGSFDGAVNSFGLRNLTDLQKGLNEMARVVKKGGKVVNLDLGKPDMPVFSPLFFFFFDNIVPLLGEFVMQDKQAYKYLPASGKSYPHPLRLAEMFAEAGLCDVRFFKLAFGSVALHVGTVM